MLCYGFPLKGSAWSAKDSPSNAPLAPCGLGRSQSMSQSIMSIPTQPIKTQSITFLISKHVTPYRTCDGTCYPGVSTPQIQSLANSSTTCHDDINHLHHSNHGSNYNIDPHMAKSHLDGSKITTLSQRHEPNSTSQKMEDLHDTHDCRVKQIYPDIIPNPKGIQQIFNLRNTCNSVTRGRKHIGSTCLRNTCLTSHLLLLKIFSS
jgi:hypothetical protein